MFLLFSFWSITYLICSFHFKDAINLKIPHNSIGKFSIKVIKFFKRFYSKFSFQMLFYAIDFLKCPLFVLLSAIFFFFFYIVDCTAIISYLGHYFPLWHGFRSDNKNFISIIFTGFILDPITGIAMIFAFLLSARSFGYFSLSITSAMLVGMVKTVIHIMFFNNHEYMECLYFLFFGCLSIYKNRKTLLHICEKSTKQDISFYKKPQKSSLSKKSKEIVNNSAIKIATKADKYYNKIQKSNLYKNYKKFYHNNQKFEENDRKYND